MIILPWCSYFYSMDLKYSNDYFSYRIAYINQLLHIWYYFKYTSFSQLMENVMVISFTLNGKHRFYFHLKYFSSMLKMTSLCHLSQGSQGNIGHSDFNQDSVRCFNPIPVLCTFKLRGRHSASRTSWRSINDTWTWM